MVLTADLGEIVQNLRAVGADISDVEVKKAEGGLPKSLRETLSAFADGGHEKLPIGGQIPPH